MTTRTITAAAALAAAVAVSALLHRRCRQLRREATAQRLMAGCDQRDNAALRRDLALFARRMDLVVAEHAAVAAAGRVLDDALALHRIEPHDPYDPYDPYQEGDAA